MADDKTKIDQREHSRFAGDGEYEAGQLASRHSLTLDQVRTPIENHGHDRDELDEAAKRLKTQDDHPE